MRQGSWSHDVELACVNCTRRNRGTTTDARAGLGVFIGVDERHTSGLSPFKGSTASWTTGRCGADGCRPQDRQNRSLVLLIRPVRARMAAWSAGALHQAVVE